MTTAIANFVPDLPADEWAVIEAFVRAAVADCDQATPYSARDLLKVSARHIRWCWRTAGLPLERAVIFHRDTIAEYIAHGCPQMTPASAGNRRSQLLRMPRSCCCRLRNASAGWHRYRHQSRSSRTRLLT